MGVMLDISCIGDSIATYQGLGSALHCSEIHAKIGVPSSYIIDEARVSGPHDICVISAGSNDPLNLNLKQNLETIRNNVKCNIVVWILPANLRASNIVKNVASEYHDKVAQVIHGHDGVHPRSYTELANEVKSTLTR